MKIEGLNPGDHRFIPGVAALSLEMVDAPEIPTEIKDEIDKRYKDFEDERASRGLKTENKPKVFAYPDWDDTENEPLLVVRSFISDFKHLVTTREAYTDSQGNQLGPLEGFDFYSVGSGALCFAHYNLPLNDGYLVFGSRHWREIGGDKSADIVIDTPPAGFMDPDTDLDSENPTLKGIIREVGEEIATSDHEGYASGFNMRPDIIEILFRHKSPYININGAMVSNYWRNVTATFDVHLPLAELEKQFNLSEEGDILVARRKDGETTKYGEDGIYLHPLGTLDSYVADRAKMFGERAALLLQRYFEDK